MKSNHDLAIEIFEFLNELAKDAEDSDFQLLAFGGSEEVPPTSDNEEIKEFLVAGLNFVVTIDDEGFGYSFNMNPEVHPCEYVYYIDGIIRKFPSIIRYEPFYGNLDGDEPIWGEDAENARVSKLAQNTEAFIMPLNTTLH